MRRGTFALNREVPMKNDELKEALRLVTKVSTDSRIGPDQGNRLQIAKRELLAVARSGKLDRHRLFRAVESIATVLSELVEDAAAPK